MSDEAFEEWLEEVKGVEMDAVLEYEGIEIRHQGNTKFIKCPNPNHNDHNPSCVVKPHYCRCFSCGFQAGALKLIQTLHGYDSHGSDFLEAANLLASIGGLPQWEAKAHRDSDSDEKRCPITQKQFKLLGLYVTNSVFIPTGTALMKPNEGETYEVNIVYTPTGHDIEYVTGYNDKVSIYDLFREDEVTFNYIVLGKLHERLSEMISNHVLEYWADDEDHVRLEEDIELLLPLAQMYQPVSKGYGYDFSWISMYHATRKNTLKTKFKLAL